MLFAKQFALWLFFALFAFSTQAQVFNLSSQDKGSPLEVYADNGIEWVQGDKLFIARGNARAARGGLVIRADSLYAYYDQTAAGGSELSRMEAHGNVRIDSPTATAYGDKGEYDMKTGVMLLIGNGLRLITQTDEITANQSLEYYELKQQAIAKGNAVAKRGDRKIEADVIVADLMESRDKKQELKKARADGNVVITTKQDVAYGDSSTYNAESEIATITGNVRIVRDKNQLNGGYAEINMKTGVSKLFAAAPGKGGGSGRVQGVLVPDKNKGANR